MRVFYSLFLSLLLVLGGCSEDAKTKTFPDLVLNDDDTQNPNDKNNDDNAEEEVDDTEEEEEVEVIAVSVSVSPADVLMTRSGMQTFTATVVGADNKNVTWSVSEVDGGTITESGNYTAPNVAGVYHIVATSVADTTKSASVAVTVDDVTRISVSVDPATVDVVIGTTQAFTATLTGSNQGVTWYTTGGSITSAGLFTPPAAEGTVSVVATANADTTKTATATVSVIYTPGSIIVVGPLNNTVETGASVALSASVAGAKGNQIAWSVTEADGGTVSLKGVYTAPAVVGTYHVVATSKLDATQFVTYTITVVNPL